MRVSKSSKAFAMALAMVFGTLSVATAADPQAEPFVFIGTAAECGGPAGSHIVTAAWLGGMGLPDNGGPNGVPATANDPHRGLLLSKNGPTPDCSAAGATIKNPPRTLTELNFDYRKGGHCGAGAPRFNVTSKAGFTYFFGCIHGAHSPAPQDPAQWERVVWNATQGTVFPASPTAPPFVFGATEVKSISIIYDEGTDTPSVEDPNGVGLAVLDNISINTKFIRSGEGIEDGTKRNRGKNGDNDNNGHGNDDDDDDDD
jgi:hypothetical protein